MASTIATLESLIDASRRLDGSGIDPTRAAARARLEATGLPLGRRPEAWKYTPLEPFYGAELAAAHGRAGSAVEVSGATAVDTGVRIERVRGALPKPIADATARIDFARHPLAVVNTAIADDVLLIEVADGAAPAAPLVLNFPRGDWRAHCSRVHVRVGRNSRLTLHEHVSDGACSNRVLTIEIGAGAHLRHERIEAGDDVACWGLAAVAVGDDATYHAAMFALPAGPRRSDVHVHLRGRGASAEIVGAIAAAGRASLDLAVVVEHFGPRTTCRERIHGVAGGHGQLTFNGRIEIHPAADGADAELRNRNLLLAPTARVNTKPELEILNRDVRCSHGATVGQIDPAQLFYLRSRGISDADAHALLLHAFIAQCLTPFAYAAGLDRTFAEVLRT